MNHPPLLPDTIPTTAPSMVALRVFMSRSPKGHPLILNHAPSPWLTRWTYMTLPLALCSLLDETSHHPLTSLNRFSQPPGLLLPLPSDTLTHFLPLSGVLKTPVYPSCEASASQLTAGPSRKAFPLGHMSETLNSNIYWEFLSTLWTSWIASMNDNVSTASPLALRIETWTFHSKNGVMLRFLLRLP